jgi:hypothetical protein
VIDIGEQVGLQAIGGFRLAAELLQFMGSRLLDGRSFMTYLRGSCPFRVRYGMMRCCHRETMPNVDAAAAGRV